MEGAKKRVFSGIQPSGMLTLGNYLGALRNWVPMQDEFDCIFSVADLHAITIRQEPAAFRRQILETYAILLAVGISPEKSILFLQSHVSAHAEMAWLLDCYTQFGELSRMTQFKDKSARYSSNVNAGLFTYPSLMAGDILLYQAELVPVGADQKQHLELSRTVAERFNGLYGPVFTVPEPYIPKVGARVMSLQDPRKKMSKSDENHNAFVSLLDKPDDIIRKFKRAVTDSESEVKYADGKDGVNNLMGIYASVTGKTMDEIQREFEGEGYGVFKSAVGEAVVDLLRPIQQEFDRLIADKGYLEACWKTGAARAARLAGRTLAKAMKKIGFIR